MHYRLKLDFCLGPLCSRSGIGTGRRVGIVDQSIGLSQENTNRLVLGDWGSGEVRGLWGLSTGYCPKPLTQIYNTQMSIF